ncbi:hypothetical protein FJQ54_12880 [Sandaracinobacter neustonicus]|uniref:Uncharacterized protein n=1 Tax=Sandaracinobacter neustonicus TaxID=1715348 RepID=A0A501XHP6_9SPHN|nr:hypothetical protein [Sandaracinobacter neustonicus]TPE59817.1 hypothetical protein FJQ54_12880 [Sandaracinobacter neustonicus]
MIGLFLICAQAAAEPPPVPNIVFDLKGSDRTEGHPATSGDDIVVTARSGENPARLGAVLPTEIGPLLPPAALNLGGGAILQSYVKVHPRESVPEMHISIRIPF